MVVFHALGALALLIFAAGVTGRVRFWLGGSLPGVDDRSLRTKALALARRAVQSAFRPATLRALFWDALALRQVWRESRLRWLVHVSIAYSFVGLFVIGSLGNMAADLGVPLQKDDAWFAVVNDGLGLALLAGIGLAAARRYLFPSPHTRSLLEDGAILAVLALLAVNGFLVEAARYLKEGTPASAGGFAFLGYPVSQAVEPLKWDWAAVYDSLWWAHALTALGLVAYLPYSKLFHMFASPVTIALDAQPDPQSHRAPPVAEAESWPA